MASLRNQIVTAFCTKLNAQRAISFSQDDRLPARVLWDLQENAEKNSYAGTTVTLSVVVQSMMDAGADDEGDVLDAALLQIQLDALTYESGFDELIDRVVYTGGDYEYSRDGSSVVGLSATFDIHYSFTVDDLLSTV